MTTFSAYTDTNCTLYPDGFARERIFRSSGDMVSQPQSETKAGFLARMLDGIAHWRMKRAGRLVLREMTDDRLRDIGITRAQAEAEASKSLFID